jgi:hypothetical protein
MVTPTPAPAPVNVEDDKSKPWKAIVAALATALLVALRDYFAGANETSWEGILSALVSAVITFAVTYVTRNPKVTVARKADR